MISKEVIHAIFIPDNFCHLSSYYSVLSTEIFLYDNEGLKLGKEIVMVAIVFSVFLLICCNGSLRMQTYLFRLLLVCIPRPGNL